MAIGNMGSTNIAAYHVFENQTFNHEYQDLADPD